MTLLNTANHIYQMDPILTNHWNQIENLQVLYGAAAPEMFSDLKSSWRQIFEIKKKLEEFAHDVPFGVV